MMGVTNYLGVVGGGKSPKFATNKAIIWDDMKGKIAIEITALASIRGIQLSREHIVVVLQNAVRVYKFAKGPDLLHIYETADNQFGLCRLAGRLLAFPGRTAGQVNLVDLATGNISIIPAHSSALRAIAVSPDGELLATASEMGTLIRIFATSNCAKLAELRRGIDPATIFSLGFSPSGTLLACTSDKSTLHIFDVPHPKKPGSSRRQSDGEESKWGLLSRIPILPRMFSDVYSFTVTNFDAGDQSSTHNVPLNGTTVLGTQRPQKGIIGWTAEDSLVVIGAGQDALWEKFDLRISEDGKRYCVRDGWKRYLGN